MPATTPKVRLWLSFRNTAKLALSIPLDKCVTYAVYPLKWLRYLGFTIYGHEGYISLSRAGPELDYTAAIEACSYYFISDALGEPCLVDADAVDDRTSIASNLTIRRRDFRANVVERDGTCVMTGDIETFCTACHILPHSKGSNYILNVIHHRGGPESPDDISDINDIRNGLLLVNQLHLPFGAGWIAFLKTPNFCLTVNDIPYNLPNAADGGTTSRLTLQHFVDLPQLGVVTPNLAPHNSDARQPQDTSEWPPAVITDLFYAAAAMNAWSSRSFIEYVRDQSSSAYYPEGGDGDEDNDSVSDSSGSSHVHAQMGNQITGQSGFGRYDLRSRNKKSNAPPEESRFADLMDVVSTLWMQSSRMCKKKTEDVHASSLSRNEGVKKWLVEVMEDPDSEDVQG